MAIEVNNQGCPYKGDGLVGWGKLMEGFAISHGRIEEDNTIDTTQKVIDTRALMEDILTDYDKDVQHLTGAQRECLVNSMATACADYNNNVWTTQQAKDDVKDITDALFDQYHENVVPMILNKQCTKGLYNDTSTQLILDRAYSEVQDKASILTLDNINKYFDNYQKLGATLIGFIQQAIADTSFEDFSQTQDRDQTENNEQDLTKTVKEDRTLNRSLNLQDLAVDMAAILIASAIFESILLRSYGNCGN